ncbi:MAG: hypothetical protein IPH44_31415 [Myxococcales bacterium]|nr:hypothetical protein [Myxococcales bacterium]
MSLKLADFGVATMGDPTITAEHARVGTPAYMAPEQLRGDGRAPAVDVWAVGATAYELHRRALRRPRRDGARRGRRPAPGRRRRHAGRGDRAGGRRRAIGALRRRGRHGAGAGAAPRRARRAVAIVAAAAGDRRRRHAGAAPAPTVVAAGRGRAAAAGLARVRRHDRRSSLDYARHGLPHILAVELQPVPGLATIDYQELRQHGGRHRRRGVAAGRGSARRDGGGRRRSRRRGGPAVAAGGAVAARRRARARALGAPRGGGRRPRVAADLAPQLASAVLGRAVTLAPPRWCQPTPRARWRAASTRWPGPTWRPPSAR